MQIWCRSVFVLKVQFYRKLRIIVNGSIGRKTAFENFSEFLPQIKKYLHSGFRKMNSAIRNYKRVYFSSV